MAAAQATSTAAYPPASMVSAPRPGVAGAAGLLDQCLAQQFGVLPGDRSGEPDQGGAAPAPPVAAPPVAAPPVAGPSDAGLPGLPGLPGRLGQAERLQHELGHVGLRG